MALYSEKVMDHFQHPRNVGVIEDANGVGEVGNAKCGDIMKIYLKIEDDIIKDVKFETFGCGRSAENQPLQQHAAQQHPEPVKAQPHPVGRSVLPPGNAEHGGEVPQRQAHEKTRLDKG